ncbi:MAG: hypothetical protein P4L99_16500 [Chthoniobacter sp.]|nr:hypothetical protein [Chthoniobacter sp.]
MVKQEDIIIDIGRAVGGDFIRVTHQPTGIFRTQGPPLLEPGKARDKMLREIEAELIERGLTQHIIPDYHTKRKGKRS